MATKCLTPGAHYNIDITPRFIRIQVALPEALRLDLSEEQAIALEDRLHRNLEVEIDWLLRTAAAKRDFKPSPEKAE